MAKGIKGIQVRIDGDTTPLNKALASVSTNARSLQSELRGVNSLLKLDPENTELIAQKQVILTKAIEETEEKMKLLTQAEREMAAAGKDINDEGYRSLQREIALTATKLQDLKKEQSTFEELSKKAKTFGQSLAETVQKIPGIKNLAQAFTNVKEKIGSVVKENEQIKKISQYANSAKEKVSSFAEKVPAVKKVGEAFGAVKDKVSDLTSKLPSITNALKDAGTAAAGITANVAKAGFKAMGAAAAGAGAAVAALTTQSIQNYAEYEQLIGGVETLFKTSAGSVLQYANNAYKTAGMSANEYMETVTSFSASLLQSLDGDTEAAAKKADLAITDMSDNANKMGSSMESIQNTYQGFAKQNYTMLDNLKLGYGGTKEEMQRLLKDAEAISGIEYDISSYADVVDAIHVIQTEMGITGTTAKEASSTIQGSITSAGSAWENWLTGMADEEADFEALTEDLVDAIMTVVENIAPRILSTIPRIVDGLGNLVSQLATYVPSLIQELLPPLMAGISDLLNTLMAMLPEMLGIMGEIVPQIISIISEMLPQLITAGIDILTSLLQGIIDTIPLLIQTIMDLFPVIVSVILENLPKIVQMGLDLLVSLVNGIVQAIPQLVEMLPTIITTIVNQLISMLPQIIETGIMLLNSLVSGIVQAIPALVAMLPQIISSIVDTLTQNLPKIIESGIELIGALVSGLLQALPELVAAVPQIISAIWDTIKNVDWLSLGADIIDGIIVGVQSAASNLIDTLGEIAEDALESVKEFFGIASPSRVMRDEVGKMLPAGMAIGVEEGMDDAGDRIQEAMRKGVPTTIDSYINTRAGNVSAETATTAAGGFTQNITINSQQELSPSEVARQTRNQTRQMVLQLQRG